MKVYKVVRKFHEYDIDDNDFLKFLKEENPDDEDIQNATNLREVIDRYGCIDEFDGDLERYIYISGSKKQKMDSWVAFYEDIDDAQSDMEYGVH